MKSTKIHLITIMVADFDDLGMAGVQDTLVTMRYPNHCIAPQIVAGETREVEWDDDHPLNKTFTWRQALGELFGRKL